MTRRSSMGVWSCCEQPKAPSLKALLCRHQTWAFEDTMLHAALTMSGDLGGLGSNPVMRSECGMAQSRLPSHHPGLAAQAFWLQPSAQPPLKIVETVR